LVKGGKMKKIIAVIFIFGSIANAYFDGGLNYTSGSNGYSGQDAYILVGFDNIWIKPEYSAYKSDNIDTYRKYSGRVGFEKSAYTLSFFAGLTPEVNKYENKFGGADITFSLTPPSGNKKRMAGPNSGYTSRSGNGVTQIDLGAGVNYIAHTNQGKDLAQIDASFFAGAKILMAQISANYSFSSYDKTMTLANVGGLAMNEKVAGINSNLTGYPKSNVNVKVDLIGYPMLTPFISYTKTKFKLASTDDLNTYTFGAYIDLNMIGATVSYETYKLGNDRKNFLSVSAGIRF